MIDSAAWQENNTLYLSAAIAEVRDRLEKQVQKNRPTPLVEGSPSPKPAQIQGVEVGAQRPEAKSFWRKFGRAEDLAHVVVPVAEKADAAAVVAVASKQNSLAKVNAAAAPAEPGQVAETIDDAVGPPALVTLAMRLHLSRFECDLLVLCLAAELDTGIERLCAQAQNDEARPYPTFALALAIFDEPAWEALSPDRPLRYWRLIEITQLGGQPLTTSRLRADERIVNYAKGLNYLDDRMSALMTPMKTAADEGLIPESQRRTEEEILGLLKQAQNGPGPVLQMIGRDSSTKELVAADVCRSLNLRLYRMPAALIPAQAVDIEPFARLWQRESLLLPGAMYLDAQGTEMESSTGQATNLLLARARGLIFLDTREMWTGARALAVEVDKPTAEEQKSIWIEMLGTDEEQTAKIMAAQFDLGLPEIRNIAQSAKASVANTTTTVSDRVWSSALIITRPAMDALAQHIDTKAEWDDIVLPATEMGLLHEIADQVSTRATVYREWGFADKMSRGLGITALFAGPSGVGKTLAAEVLASSLKLELYRVDLSSVVSKYIGETEKNLRKMFDAAEGGGSILFFDEADALFGKRSEVKDSHDRYANIEVNYLLQRMESYRGLAILATNVKSALDAAFVRRLRFIVTFPFPGVSERKAIWERVFPPKTPTQDLDFARLARLNVTGGHIHNIALNAAFRAAQNGTPVTMALVLDSARNEFGKLERPVNEADFRLPGVA
jgi:hypothetical protein